MTNDARKPIVLITGAAGNLGRSIGAALSNNYQVVGLDRSETRGPFPTLEVDLASDASVELALQNLRVEFGSRIASVIHLVAYFDFTGEDHPLYRAVNVDGTKRLRWKS